MANAGQVAGRITTIRPVAEIITEMWDSCQLALAKAAQRLGSRP